MKIPQNECMNVVKTRLENLVKFPTLGDGVSARTLGGLTSLKVNLKHMRSVGIEHKISLHECWKKNEWCGIRTQNLLAKQQSKEKF